MNAPGHGATIALALGCALGSSVAHAQRPAPAATSVPARPAMTTLSTRPAAGAALSARPVAQPARTPAEQRAAPAASAAPSNSENEDESTGRSPAEFEAMLARVRTDNPQVRRAAIDAVLDLDASDVPAIRERLLAPLGVSHFNVHAHMIRAIRAFTGGNPNADYDLLEVLLRASPRTPELDVAIERVVLARALGRIQTADAGRALLPFATAHGRIFRLETLRIIRTQLREYIIPALIEVRTPNDDMRALLRQIRSEIRRNTPGESVQTRDNALLAEILRAFGATHQLDAINVVVSFVNSDRVQVREAARWAVSQYGREAINALRTAYENFVGEDPDPQWGWERVSRELYEAYDRRRAEEVQSALEQGLDAARAGRHEEMMRHFAFVLTRHPLYERRVEMVEPLVRYARQLESRDAARAMEVYRTALRIDPDGPARAMIQSAILYLEAERSLARGVADPELYRAALRADPSNARARAQLEAVAQVEVLRARKRTRTLVALGLLLLSLAGLGLFIHRIRSSERRGGSGSEGDAQRSSGNSEGETASWTAPVAGASNE